MLDFIKLCARIYFLVGEGEVLGEGFARLCFLRSGFFMGKKIALKRGLPLDGQ